MLNARNGTYLWFFILGHLTGGFELGLLRSGLVHEIKWQVEINDYATKVLEKNFPTVKRYRDIKDVGKHNLETVDLICGGFPCQPFSTAGKRKGKEDDRYLWPEMFRCIKEIQPSWVIGENVPGIVNMELDKALSDLEGIGYETINKLLNEKIAWQLAINIVIC